MTFARIEAQAPAVSVLQRALRADRLGQSFLFVGPSGVGKQLAATALACAANCLVHPNEGCAECESCRRIREGVHPDVRVFAPRDEGNRNLQVEALRAEVLPFAKFAPFEARAAFLIFPQADVSFPVIHPEAANALLKTLEEPRPHVHFVLLSERPDRLLPTIRSRCQRVRFTPLPAAVLDRILEGRGVDEPLRKAAVAIAGGRADRAIELCEGDRAERLLATALEVDRIVASGSAAELLEAAETLTRSEERALVLESLALYYRDVAAAGLGLEAEALRFSAQAGAIAERAKHLSPLAAAERVARLHELEENLSRNANPEIALDGMLFTMNRRP
jgi:DNA polymerase-3 subunit delta'